MQKKTLRSYARWIHRGKARTYGNLSYRELANTIIYCTNRHDNLAYKNSSWCAAIAPLLEDEYAAMLFGMSFHGRAKWGGGGGTRSTAAFLFQMVVGSLEPNTSNGLRTELVFVAVSDQF